MNTIHPFILSGPAPVNVTFTDTSTGSPTSWSWSFGDGNTSTLQNPSHIYTAAGTYDVNHSATNGIGTGWLNRTAYVNVTGLIPVANFTATPTSGNALLTVQFSDESTGEPISWSWSFGDGNTSTEQNPSHIYEAAGTYDVGLTAANAGGSNATVKAGYVVVTAPAQTTFYVYADGVSLYHGFESNGDLYYSNITPGNFYDKIIGKCGDPYLHTCWYGIGKPIDDATGSKNWNKSEDADNYANKADFSLHAGHGWEDGIMFGTANNFNKMYRTDMKFSNAKWVAFFSCLVLNSTYWENWKSVFDGAHIVMGFDTVGWEANHQGELFAQHMTKQDGKALKNIRDSWKETLQRTVDRDDTYAAYMWADPCKDDYLPGWGSYCSAPIKGSNGQYTIDRESFKCKIS